MYKYLLEIIKKMEGNVIGIGMDQKLLSGFNKNKKVNVYTINSAPTNFGIISTKKRKTNTGKIISIKKLYKYFKKRSNDYIICNYKEVDAYLKYYIRDSVYINKKAIYLYGSKEDIDVDLLIKRYKRYNVSVDIKEFKENILLILDTSNTKFSKIKNKFYYISDTAYNFIDFISNILVS